MNKSKYPNGIPYIIGNELAERFSYYGMRAILTIFMTDYLLDSSGALAPMSESESKVVFHLFVMAAYAFPLVGALVSDLFIGKYKTIISLSIVYCLGHLALSLDETRLGLWVGLSMIAIGAGGIKPCVSAHVGDQFGKSNSYLLEKIFNVFYLSINLGAILSTLIIPILLDKYGPTIAFGVPGVLMILATIAFWIGRKSYTSVPPSGWNTFKLDIIEKGGYKTLLRLSLVYLIVSVFFSLFDQTGSSWTIQAKSELMNRSVDLIFWKGELLPSQIQFLNPLLVLIFVPTFTWGLYPAINKVFKLTALRKMSIGMFIAALSFVIIAMIQVSIDNGNSVSIIWQFVAYAVLTSSEVMVYGTGLEFSYTQAPNSMKSLVMSMFMLSISLGNGFTALVNSLITDEGGDSFLGGANYFWFFTALMGVAAVVFIFVAMNYKEKNYIQEHE